MLVLFFLYLGYIALASAERERGGEGRITAIYGLVGAINLPIIHYSVLWWRTLHQGQSISLGRIDDRQFAAVAAAADDGRLHLPVRRGRADADARRACRDQGRGALAPDGLGMTLGHSSSPLIAWLSATAGLLLWSLVSMRRAEAAADALTRK